MSSRHMVVDHDPPDAAELADQALASLVALCPDDPWATAVAS